MDTSAKLVAFHAFGSCSLATLVALEDTELPYRGVAIDLKGDRTDFRVTNPGGRMPALLDDGELLTETPAILYRLAGKVPELRLFPNKARDIARMLSMLCWFSSGVHIPRRSFRAPNHFSADPVVQADISGHARPAVHANLCLIDALLIGQKWLFGAEFSFADAYALVFCSWARVDGFDLSEFQRLDSWRLAMLERPAVRRALAIDCNTAVAA